MNDILNNMLPFLDAVTLSKGIQDPLSSIANTVLSTSTKNLINPLAKTTVSFPANCPKGFHSIMACATTNTMHDLTTWNAPNPSLNESQTIDHWLDRMNALYLSGNQSLICLLDQLCGCTKINLYVKKGKGLGQYGWVWPLGNNSFDILLSYQMINDFSTIKSNNGGEWVTAAFNSCLQPSIDLTASYFNYDSATDLPIGIIVHELVHIFDTYFYPSYFAIGSDIHTFMWETWYFLECYGNAGSYSFPTLTPPNAQDLTFLNPSWPLTCWSMLAGISNSPPATYRYPNPPC